MNKSKLSIMISVATQGKIRMEEALGRKLNWNEDLSKLTDKEWDKIGKNYEELYNNIRFNKVKP
jgi:hypothetical protein